MCCPWTSLYSRVGKTVEMPPPPPSSLEECLEHLCILWKNRARFPADTHKPYNLALEKKNGLEQENIFRAHYSSRSHREGARTEPVNKKQLTLQGQEEACAWHSEARQETASRATGSVSRSGISKRTCTSLSKPVLETRSRTALLPVLSSPWLLTKVSSQ